MSTRAAVVWTPQFLSYDLGDDHPLDPVRLDLTMRLATELGVMEGVEPVDPKAGHIPGARNLPATEITGPDGRVRAPAELAERFAARGATGAALVAAYCGSGVNAAALVLAAEHAGLRTADDPVALFPGSWSQWSADPRRPVATGVDP